MRRVVVGLAIAFATLTPTWARANDQQIAQAIIQKLEQQKQAGQLKGFGIDLQVEDGTVFMNGRVASPEHQQIALGIAQRTPGVKQVVNGLKVNSADAAANAPAAVEQTKQSSLLAGWGGSVKKALGRESTQSEIQQATKVEPVDIPQVSVIKKHSPEAQAYTAETGAGARNIPASARMQQSQMVASQPAPGYSLPAPPIAHQEMAPRALQSQLHASNPVVRATMPGHNGPTRPTQTPYPYALTSGYHAGQVAPVPYGGGPVPAHMPSGVGVAPARYDHPHMPAYSWPSYASYPNYAAVTYPKQYSPTAWPYIGPFYPYPQVPLGWRKVTLEWDDGWWMLDFKDQSRNWKPHR